MHIFYSLCNICLDNTPIIVDGILYLSYQEGARKLSFVPECKMQIIWDFGR